MSTDREIETADSLLANACSDVSDAVSAQDSLDGEAARRYKRHLANALVQIWEAREALFNKRPDLRHPSMPQTGSLPSE